MPPMPPAPGAPAAAALVSSLMSAMRASVVSIKPAMDAAFCRARRVTLAGSMTPIFTMSPYSPVSALNPKFSSLDSRILPITTAPSEPALRAIWRVGSSSARRTMLAHLLDAAFDFRWLAGAFNDGGVVLVDGDLLGAAEVLDLHVLELDAEIF